MLGSITISDFLDLIQTVAVVATLYYISIQAKSLIGQVGFLKEQLVALKDQITFLREQHEDNHDWNRRESAQQAVREYREIQSMIEAVSHHFDYQNRTEGIPLSEFKEKFSKDRTLQPKVNTVLNYFEGLARGVNQGIYDEGVIKGSFRGQMSRVFDSFQYFISDRRKYLNNSQIWVDIENLSCKWKVEFNNGSEVRKKTGMETAD